MNDEALDAAIATERAAVDRMVLLADQLASQAGPVWHFGNGEGGWVRDELERAFDRHGLPRLPKIAPERRKISAPVRRAVFEADAYRCRSCGDHHDLVLDHIVPVVEGGGDHVENLQTLCARCNQEKGPRRRGGKGWRV